LRRDSAVLFGLGVPVIGPLVRPVARLTSQVPSGKTLTKLQLSRLGIEATHVVESSCSSYPVCDMLAADPAASAILPSHDWTIVNRLPIVEEGAMVEVIVPSRATSAKYPGQRFGCGDTYENLLVVNFSGPGGVKASAYCCNMNIDIDGEPQAYAPSDNPRLNPKENLWNGGWLTPAQNQVKKDTYDNAKKAYEELEQKKADLVTKSKPSDDPAKPAPAPPTPAAMKKLDEDIDKAKKAMIKAAVFWDADPRPKYFGEKFWHWYGPVALTPDDAQKRPSFTEPSSKTAPPRRPVLDNQGKPELEDAYGQYPVVQSDFEPGPGYYVAGLPRRTNTAFPDWDQRSYLPPNSTTQVAYAALSVILEDVTKLHLNDVVLGMRLDNGAALTFPFLDHGYEPKVGECSIEAFEGLGGVLAANINKSENNFLVLYLAFAKSVGQTADSMLTRFASAPNADDFPVMLAFIAQATVDAKAAGRKTVRGDPLTDFQRWKASQGTRSPGVLPGTFAAVDQALSNAGFSPFTQRMLKRHPSLLGGPGPWLRGP
jgi:hypothetical protein